ncbi:Dynactin subunit 5 [Hypocenomyce scalaris]|nr:Dynactin subunit 5 [Hypocenomyce scalaris]
MPPPRDPTTTSTTPRAPKSEYISTDTGNKISRRSQIHGTQNIILGGRTVIQAHAVIRGDLVRPGTGPPTTSTTTTSSSSTPAPPKPTVSISIGRYTIISPHATLRPPFLASSSSGRPTPIYTPLRIGDHVLISAHCVIEAAAIGSYVHVGAGSVVGKFAIIKDGVKILPGTVVPGGMVVPSGVVVGGRPGRVLGEVGEGWGVQGGEGGDLREVWRAVG